MTRAHRHLWTAAGAAQFRRRRLPAAAADGALHAARRILVARGSEPFHRWLIHHPSFGPSIRDWQAHGAISLPAKRAAVVAIAAAFAISLLVGMPRYVLAIRAAVLAAVLVASRRTARLSGRIAERRIAFRNPKDIDDVIQDVLRM